jgi:hypothetical protein
VATAVDAEGTKNRMRPTARLLAGFAFGLVSPAEGRKVCQKLELSLAKLTLLPHRLVVGGRWSYTYEDFDGAAAAAAAAGTYLLSVRCCSLSAGRRRWVGAGAKGWPLYTLINISDRQAETDKRDR